ncbi:MAG: 3-phosphoshikimate 1-carboxyvinyltransferase [Gemmatimonadetes bacterium]|nr:3-phosphoshikimate 1-carboxyvinyltransferase [Gemmatimonadota bacterium]
MPDRSLRHARVPGDKSITHRALLAAALTGGLSRIREPLVAGDTNATRRVLTALGVPIETLPAGELQVVGRGLRGLIAPEAPLDCGNSGTTARLLLGILAAQPLVASLTGDDSLRSRPMRRVTRPLREMGARIRELGDADRLPVEITGGELRPLRFEDATASAQVKSAVLLAGLCGGQPVTVTEPLRSRDHTERLLRGLGVPLSERSGAAGHEIRLEPVGQIPPFDVTVPGDFSAAAFLVAAALLLGTPLRIHGVGVNPTRTGLLDVLARMGAPVAVLEPRQQGAEPVADLLVSAGELRGTTVVGTEIPALVDEVPVLAVLAARAEGETTITGAGELRVKESDRISMLVANLRAIGVVAEELPDGLVVQGTRNSLRGAVATAGDHRIAMAFGVLGALPGCELRIDDRAAAAVSFPGFWQELRRLETGP